MAEQSEQNVSLSELRENANGGGFVEWLHRHCPFFFDFHSLFFFGAFLTILAIFWFFYSLFFNSGTQLYGWDYSSQYVTMGYNFWDTWRNFFHTGYFQLYGEGTYLGTDSIGSNSYYGLFDPFLFVCYLLPRAWVPQTFALATVVKLIVGAFAMRAYLKYMGISETSSRLGAVAFAFSGYMNFMVGFPSFVSMCSFVPLVLLGVEKAIKEKKILILSLSLCLLGMVSFLFLVVNCIWGVIYALWRYFASVRKRDLHDNLAVIGMGILGFALGIGLCSWTLFPSLRESVLSGRTTSLGASYLATIKTAFANQDFATLFHKFFEMVGDHPVREIQPLIGFLFPTCNYTYLPMVEPGAAIGNYHYDSLTASLFCYTPVVILFFTALISSIRRKKWSHLVIFGLCCYLLFTDFAYFFFFAFTGDGYGRWYIVLLPLIIYYAMQELDRLKEEPKWMLPAGSVTSLFLTVFTWILVVYLFSGKTFTYVSGATYWAETYAIPGYIVKDGTTYSLLFLIYGQMALVAIEGIAMLYLQKKDYFWKALLGFMSLEIVVAGNLSFVYGSSWSYDNYYNGGSSFVNNATHDVSLVTDNDSSYYRATLEGIADTNSQNSYGYNGTSFFHSLFNYDVNDLNRYSALSGGGWSGYYGNKRYALDTALGMKYYFVESENYPSKYAYIAPNVPFGSKEVYSGETTSSFKIYENAYRNEVALGHAVDTLYAQGSTGEKSDAFSSYFGDDKIQRNEEIYLDGAIVKDDDVEDLKNRGMTFSNDIPTSASRLKSVAFKAKTYHTSYLFYGPVIDDKVYLDWGPATFLEKTPDGTADGDCVKGIEDYKSDSTLTSDYDKLTLLPRTGTYFNEDYGGAYFELKYTGRRDRIWFIGDKKAADGSIIENQVLSYEYNTIRDYCWRDWNGGSDSGTSYFGFYPEGRVKAIVFCAKPSDFSTFSVNTNSLKVTMTERSDYEAEQTKLASSNYNLTNVKHWTDNFTFDTAFDQQKLCVTTLGYDAGWHVKGTYVNDEGTKVTVVLPTYKLDGGFVGFLAPKGEVSYHLYYETPYLKGAALITSASVVILSLVEGLSFHFARKKKDEELGIKLVRKTAGGPDLIEEKKAPKKIKAFHQDE